MKLQGEQEFDVPRDIVWETILKPEVLEECIPGAQTVEKTSDDAYEGTVERGLASITITMEITVEIVDDDRPGSVICSIEGTDNRINSTVDGEAEVDMEETDDGSVLSYEANLDFTGKLASIGGRIIKRQMNKDLDKFFSNVEEYIGETEATA